MRWQWFRSVISDVRHGYFFMILVPDRRKRRKRYREGLDQFFWES